MKPYFKFINDFRYKCFISWFEFKTIFYKIFIFNFWEVGMVIFIESIIFADVLGYIYEKKIKNFTYYLYLQKILKNFICSIVRFF
jgi:hypothetical protein